MNCPICKSNQTSHYSLKYNLVYLECANCDYEGDIQVIPADMEASEAFGAFQSHARGMKRGSR